MTTDGIFFLAWLCVVIVGLGALAFHHVRIERQIERDAEARREEARAARAERDADRRWWNEYQMKFGRGRGASVPMTRAHELAAWGLRESDYQANQ